MTQSVGKAITAILISSIISFIYVFYLNKYPFFWNDSETYIRYAVDSMVTKYGTTAYPVFIKISLGLVSLWFTIFAQMFLAACVLWKFCISYFPKISLLQFTLLNLFLLLSSYHFFIDTVMPDIFLPLGFLLFIVFIREDIKLKSLGYYLLFCFCVIAHNGFPYTFLLFYFAFLPFLFWKDRSKKLLSKSVFILSMILIATFVFKPLLALTYEDDQRDRRNLNFFCRQILLTKYERLFQETLDLGCVDFPSKVCNLTQSKQDMLKLKYFNTWEPDCKHIFLTAMNNSGFRWIYIKSKASSIFKMYSRLGTLANSGSNIGLHDEIKSIIKPDPFLKMENSHVNQNNNNLKSSLQSKGKIVYLIYTISLFGIILFLLLSLILRKKYSWLQIDYEMRQYLIGLFIFIFSALLFYGLFSRPSNTRYAMRLGWLVPLSFFLLLLNNWLNYKRINQANQKSQQS